MIGRTVFGWRVGFLLLLLSMPRGVGLILSPLLRRGLGGFFFIVTLSLLTCPEPVEGKGDRYSSF